MTEYISSQHLPQSPFPSTTPLLGETAPHATLAGRFVFLESFSVLTNSGSGLQFGGMRFWQVVSQHLAMYYLLEYALN